MHPDVQNVLSRWCLYFTSSSLPSDLSAIWTSLESFFDIFCQFLFSESISESEYAFLLTPCLIRLVTGPHNPQLWLQRLKTEDDALWVDLLIYHTVSKVATSLMVGNKFDGLTRIRWSVIYFPINFELGELQQLLASNDSKRGHRKGEQATNWKQIHGCVSWVSSEQSKLPSRHLKDQMIAKSRRFQEWSHG